jgi:hypothetical protein
MAGLNVFENGTVKTIDFSPWGGIDGFLSVTSGGAGANIQQLRKVVPWLNKAINMTSSAVAQMPYMFTNAQSDEMDTDTVWGAVKNPQTLITLISASLCGGAGYLLADVASRGIISLQYLAPQTITPNFTASGELVDFTRSNGKNQQRLSKEQVIYFWLPDDTVEVGPAVLTPNANAMLSAGILASMDETLRIYGERGFIPPMLLSAKGMPNKAEAEKTERWWNMFLRGWTKSVAKIINAEAMTPSKLGAGFEELKGSYIEVTNQQIKNIAASYGIPISTFTSDEANYATAVADMKLWYTSSEFVRIYQTVEDTFTEQLFRRFGLTMTYMPEQMEAFQQEETDKSSAVATLANVFTTNPEAALTAMNILGYDLTDDQKAEIEALGEEQDEPETPAEEMTEETEPEMELPSDEENEIADALMKWNRFALKPHNAKKTFDDKSKSIPPALTLRITAGLRAAKSEDEIQAVFDAAVAELPIIMLAKAINGRTE